MSFKNSDGETVWNINIKAQVDEYQRRLIGAYYGDRKMATLDTCRRFIYGNGWESINDLNHDHGLQVHRDMGIEPPEGAHFAEGYSNDDD